MFEYFWTFDEYDTDWRNRHKSSIPQEEDFKEQSPYPSWGRLASFVAFVTSALMSGVHTMAMVYNSITISPVVDENMRKAVSYGSFISYELGMFMAAFLMTVDATRVLARRLAFTIFITLIAVNFYSVVKVYGLSDPIGAAVSISFAFVPLVAYASGKFYINIGIAERTLERRAKELYLAKKVEVEAQINRDYNAYVDQYQKALRKTEKEKRKNEARTQSVLSTPVGTPRRTQYIPGTGMGTPPKAVRDLADQLKANEGKDLKLSAAAIREKYGRGQGVANDAKKLAQWEMDNPGYDNGETRQ